VKDAVHKNAPWIEGDLLHAAQLKQTMGKQDIAYAKLAGEVGTQATESPMLR
jgi:hypothetical protein